MKIHSCFGDDCGGFGAMSRTVRIHKNDTDGVNYLVFSVFVFKRYLSVFITSKSIDIVRIFCIVSENVNFIIIIKCLINIRDCGSKLLKVNEELAIIKKCSSFLFWMCLDYS